MISRRFRGRPTSLVTAFASAFLAAAGLAACSSADNPPAPGTVQVADAWCRPTPNGAKAGGCYLTLTAGSDDRLLSVSTALAQSAEVHEMKMDNGVMSMGHLADGLPLPAGTPVELKPGGNHIMLMGLTQQITGVNAIVYFAPTMMSQVGISTTNSVYTSIVIGVVSVIACWVGLKVVDRIGRKPLLWIGSAGMAVTLAAVTAAFATGTLADDGRLLLSDSMGVLALVAANLYVIFFNASWGPVMWVMLGEMFPNQIRGSGLAVAGLFQWGANFLITWTFPMLLAGIGLAGAYGLYAAAAALSVVFVLRYVHETRGRELEQMEG